MSKMKKKELREWIKKYADDLEFYANTTYSRHPNDKFSAGIADGYKTVAVDLRMALEK